MCDNIVFVHCVEVNSDKCTGVSPLAYDAATGYVNAVGRMRVLSSLIELNSFSPLGEAIFSEYQEPAIRDHEDLASQPSSLDPASLLEILPQAKSEEPTQDL